MRAVVLVGGEGTRLRPLTSTVPKPVVTLVDRPFMAYMLEWLARHGVDEVVLACGFLPTKLREALGDGSRYGLHLTYVEEPEPRGTGGAVRFADEQLDGGLGERFLVLNGDVLTDLDLSAQIARHAQAGATGTLALVPVEDPTAYGLVRLQEDGAVAGFLEKPRPEEIDTEPHQRRRVRPRAQRPGPDRAGSQRLDRARGLAGTRRRGPARARARRRLLDRHRDARALPPGLGGHPRGQCPDRRPRAAGRAPAWRAARTAPSTGICTGPRCSATA